ncbi:MULTISPECIES: ABC transporter substrate-binding protein [Streptosporangium]|uniref:Sulfonate transport system substrate-binding protein n=1 Tax=Streptosporangium brasiliense TaxID=47480 RepID=A0ABT9R9Z1_9ACTN|nr:ABC transporter substrate-binding protein [Streptosporangium brasiliense]MDP9866073.1 sulfonate transport system substrate-binding protein [Streptosporangium brasiliense]
MAIRIGVHAHNPWLHLLSRLDHLLDGIEVHRYADAARTGELLAAGVIDFGGAGSTSSLTAQAARLPVAYAAVSAPRPGYGALLVSGTGPVMTVADLRDRPVSLRVGSWQTHFLAKVLADAGLSYQDIEPRPAASEARFWLRDGVVSGWVAEGAELVEAERSGHFARLRGTAGIIADRSVFHTRASYAESDPEAVAAAVRALRETGRWAREHPVEAARLTVEAVGGSVDSWTTALKRLPWTLEPVTTEVVAEQRAAADVLYDAGFLVARVDPAAAVVPSLNRIVMAELEEVVA